MIVFCLGFLRLRQERFPNTTPTFTPSPQPTLPSSDFPDHLPILQTIPRSNVLVLGRRGSGKSALINALFDSVLIDTTAASPPLEFLTKATIPSCQIVLYDSSGFDVNNFNDHMQKLEDILVKSNESSKPESDFDVILMTISSIGVRWETADLKLVYKSVREWGFPLGIVFTRYEGPLSDYDKDPKLDPDELEAAVQHDLTQNKIANVDFFRVNSVPKKKGEEVIYPVAGLQRLSRGLKKLVDIGLNVTAGRIKENKLKKKFRRANQTINDAVKACRSRCGGTCMSPSTLVAANADISEKMIVRLLEIFKVEGSYSEVVGNLFHSYQDGLVPQGGRLVKLVHNVELLVDSATGSSQCKRQMHKLGNSVLDLLITLRAKYGNIRTENIRDETRVDNREL